MCSVSDQTVGARDLDFLILQRANDRLEQFGRVGAPDQNVSVTCGTALDADRLALVDQAPHRARNALRELHPRAGLAHGVERRIPAFDFRALIGLGRLPNFHHAGRRIGQRDMRRESRPDPT